MDDEVFDGTGALQSATLSWIKAGNRQNKSWDNTILGNLKLEGSRLTIEVNSAKRADRIAKEIATRLGAGARLVETKVTDVMKELEALLSDFAQSGKQAPEAFRPDVGELRRKLGLD